VYSRGTFVSERALRTLPGEQKLALIDRFADMRMYGLLWSAALLIIILLLPKAFPDDPWIGYYLGTALLAIFVGVRMMQTHRRIKAMDVEPLYKQQITIAQLISTVGFVILIASVVFGTR
jgi:hypothetical protein